MRKDVVFVIIGFNNIELTRRTIISFKINMPKFELVIYDNASHPTLKNLAREFNLFYLRSSKNLGYSGGCNKAAEWIYNEFKPKAICLLNNDIAIDKDFAANFKFSLEEFLKEEKLAAMTPILFQDSAHKIPENFGVCYYQSGLAFQNRSGKYKNKAILNGAFLLLKSSVYRILMETDGYLFQPFYFFNAEDIELSLRLLSRGYSLKIDQRLNVQHLGSQSIGKSTKGFYLSWRNLVWTFLITRTNRNFITDVLYFGLGQLVFIILSITRKSPLLFIEVIKDTVSNWKSISESRTQFQLHNSSNLWRKKMNKGIFPIKYLRV